MYLEFKYMYLDFKYFVVPVVQCKLRTSESRTQLLEEFGSSPLTARARGGVVKARDAFKAQGWKPFITNPFESPAYHGIFGNLALWGRLCGDSLHLVRCPGVRVSVRWPGGVIASGAHCT